MQQVVLSDHRTLRHPWQLIRCERGGIACFDSSPYSVNCFFTDNTSVSCGGGEFVQRQSDPRIINCTVGGNISGEGNGLGFAGSAEPTITNSILRHNSAPIRPEISLIKDEFPASLTVEYSNVGTYPTNIVGAYHFGFEMVVSP